MKTNKDAPQQVDDYIARFPKEVQESLQKIRGIVKAIAPEADEVIKYGIPTFVLNGNLVHFAAYPKHIGFYPTPSGIEHFKEALAAYQHAKGSVQFPLDAPIPFSLIKKIVQFRVKEYRASSATKRR